jgi:hypothetical protein
LASIHAGLFADVPSISSASRDPLLSKMWGVDEPAAIDVPGAGLVERGLLRFKFGDTDYELFRHPFLFLSADVSAWYDEYLLMSDFGIRHSGLVSCRWLDAMRQYRFFLAKFERLNKK